MNQWGFVIAAYALVALAMAALIGWSFFGMRTAEADAEAAKRR
jgi:cytochrome c biogenesis protein ResB